MTLDGQPNNQSAKGPTEPSPDVHLKRSRLETFIRKGEKSAVGDPVAPPRVKKSCDVFSGSFATGAALLACPHRPAADIGGWLSLGGAGGQGAGHLAPSEAARRRAHLSYTRVLPVYPM